MKITLKTLTLSNFKGIKKLTVDFNDDLTNVFGDNATGKTTIFDAFTWLFFGKESTDRKDFNIKNTVDTSLNRQSHEVSAIVVIDGAETSLRRVYKEKHVKKKGSTTTEFAGHETEYFWDDVPLNQTEFNKKVNALIEESAFKLISNPSYFNSLNWKDRRNILFEIASNITNEDVAAGNAKFEALLSKLTNNKSLEDLRKQIAGQKKLIKEELEKIPVRIDEVLSIMPEEVNAPAIKKEILNRENNIADIDLAIEERSHAVKTEYDKIEAHQKLIHDARSGVNSFKFKLQEDYLNKKNSIQSDRNVIANKLTALESERNQIESQINRRTDDIKQLKLDIAAKRKDWDAKKHEWDEENSREIEFDEHEFSCPTCKRRYESDDIEGMKAEMIRNFEVEKTDKLRNITDRLNKITEQGKLYAEALKRLEVTSLDNEYQKLSGEIEAFKADLEVFDKQNQEPAKTIEEVLDEDPEYQVLLAKVGELERSLPEKTEINVDELKINKRVLASEIDELKKLLNNENVIAANKNRIADLEAEEKKLAEELAAYEGDEFILDSFNKAKIEMIESRINGMFDYVSFKMFNQQINGGESDTCETMVDNVPYSDLNNAARINAGLDIINALSKHYEAYVPVFIDNAESITQLMEVNSQIVRLVVSEQDKKLRVA